MSTPTAYAVAPAWMAAATEPRLSARAQDAPPCSRPKGWVFPSTGMRATTRPRPTSRYVTPSRSSRAARAASGMVTGVVSVMPRTLAAVVIRRLSGPQIRVCDVAETTETPRLLLLDGHSLAYRAFFALKDANLVTTTGQHTEGVYGFTSMLINVLRDEQPTHVGVAFDVSRTTFRSEAFPDYKANRTASPDEFRGQIDLVKEVLTALNIPYVEKDGYEADDVIATLTTQAA